MNKTQNNSDNMDEMTRKQESRQRSNANILPWRVKKGEVRNPAGRGIGKNLWNWASRLGAPEKLVEPMRKLFKIPYGKLNVESAIILRLALEACRGDLKAVELWLDRKYGRVPQSMDVSTTNNGPLVAIIQNVDVVKATENITEGKVIDVTPEAPAPKTQEPQDP